MQPLAPDDFHPRRTVLALVAVLATALFAGARAVRAATPPVPRRLVLIVIDQCRADYPDRYPMPHVRNLRAEGTSYADAYVGHLAAETVVSHPVISTGLFPSHLPWSDEVYRDDQGLLGERGLYYLSAFLDGDQMRHLFEPIAQGENEPESLPRLARRVLAGKVYAIGQKDYAANSLGASGADGVITLSEPMKDGPYAGWRHPTGRGLPPGLEGPVGGPLDVDGRGTHGTALLEYPHKGDLYHPAADPLRVGGDAWVARTATEVMWRDPDWRALLLTMGSVDRVGHMLGVPSASTTTSTSATGSAVVSSHGSGTAPIRSDFTVPDALAAADAAVGQVLDALDRRGLGEETLMIVCSDHGAQSGRIVGLRGPGRAYPNWYYGRAVNGDFRQPSPSIRPLAAMPQVGYVMADSAIRVWLNDRSRRAQVVVGRAMRDLPAVRAVYAQQSGKYRLIFGRVAAVSLPWEAEHEEELLGTLCGPHAPELIALLDEGVNYGAPGDHGGMQRLVQRIPLIFRGPGVPAGRIAYGQARLVDIVPTVRSLLGQPPDPALDGHALPMPERR